MKKLPIGHLPLWFVKQVGITDEELKGIKQPANEGEIPYVCVVRFDQKARES